jgi:hypothetical protein
LSHGYGRCWRVAHLRPLSTPAAARCISRLGNHRNANKSNQAKYEPFHGETFHSKGLGSASYPKAAEGPKSCHQFIRKSTRISIRRESSRLHRGIR